ncbi:MAG: slipin family protein [Candidatus Methanomethylicia archaeon]
MIDFTLIFTVIFIILIILWILASSIRVVKEYERAIVFRLGRLVGAKGPGLIFRIPIVDSLRIIDLRTVTFDVPRQRIITRDNITIEVDAVAYYRVADPVRAVVTIKDYIMATNLLGQSMLRDLLGQFELDEILARREELGKKLTELLDIATDPWGIKVMSVTIKDIVLPEVMLRAIAKQAEAERERRSRIILAEGELQAAKKMAEAAEMYAETPIALRLRELQTLAEIAREKNLIVVTPTITHGELIALAKATQTKPEG